MRLKSYVKKVFVSTIVNNYHPQKIAIKTVILNLSIFYLVQS